MIPETKSSWSVASTETLASLDDFEPIFPLEILHEILSQLVGGYLHEFIESADLTRFPKFWHSIQELCSVSSVFNAIICKCMKSAFDLDSEDDLHRIHDDVYDKLRSLTLFSRAILSGALSAPPNIWNSPLLAAYGRYIILRVRIRDNCWSEGHFSVSGRHSSVEDLAEEVYRLCRHQGPLSRCLREAVAAM